MGRASPRSPAIRRNGRRSPPSETKAPVAITIFGSGRSPIASAVRITPPIRRPPSLSSCLPLLRGDEVVGRARARRRHELIAKALVTEQTRYAGKRLQMLACRALRADDPEDDRHLALVDGRK